ncbi:hypothetical protein BGZ83_005727 [Gryganskiella cystojenkinii]|nr:hypothetical protein BGZ83_005727 [Gryganskiella cystojenkinii]
MSQHRSACRRVMAIQELQDILCSYLELASLKALSVCCKEWHRLLIAKVWTRLRLFDLEKTRRTLLEKYGYLFRTLDCPFTDKSALKAIRENCPNLEFLRLTLDANGTWIDYQFLESFFADMTKLSALYLRVDLFRFSPPTLWSLASAPHLTKLYLDAYYAQYYTSKHYHPDVFMTVLDCLPRLEFLHVQGLVFEPANVSEYHNKDSFMQTLRKTFRPVRQNAPNDPSQINNTSGSNYVRASTFSSLSISSSLSRLTGSKTMAVADQIAVNDNNPVNYQIKQLILSPTRMDDSTFCQLVCKCPHLENLYLDGVWIRFSAESWLEMAKVCKKLKHLRVRYSGTIDYMPNVQTLIQLFPKLLTISLQTLSLTEDPDLSNLGERLTWIEQRDGEQHPLRKIEITGSLRQPLKMFLEIVEQCATIEELILGTTLNCTEPAVADISTAALYLMKTPWKCFETLKVLDVTNIQFPNMESFSCFISRIQGLTQLKSLYMSIAQVRLLMVVIDADPLVVQNRHGAITNTLSGPVCFLTLRTLGIGKAFRKDRGRTDKPTRLEEVQTMIDMCPALRTLSLTHLSEAGITKELSAEFPLITFTSS